MLSRHAYWGPVLGLSLMACNPQEFRTNSKVVKACEELVKKGSGTLNLEDLVLMPDNNPTKSQDASVTDKLVGKARQALYAATTRLWERGSEVEVCWENMNPADPGAVTVKAAVERTWNAIFPESELAPGEGIRFVGWGMCAPTSKGIRIFVNDEGPHTKDWVRCWTVRPRAWC